MSCERTRTHWQRRVAVRSRYTTKRAGCLILCRELLGSPGGGETEQQPDIHEQPEPMLPECPQCKLDMRLVESAAKPSWREVFEVTIYVDGSYCPTGHIDFRNLPAAHSIGGYG